VKPLQDLLAPEHPAKDNPQRLTDFVRKAMEPQTLPVSVVYSKYDSNSIDMALAFANQSARSPHYLYLDYEGEGEDLQITRIQFVFSGGYPVEP